MTVYTVNTADIIFQLIDGEYIFLNRSNGNYFSLDNLGVLAWECILHTIPPEAFLQSLRDTIPHISEEVLLSLGKVFSDMIKEGLVIPSEEEAVTKGISSIIECIQSGDVQIIPAVLHSYKDIQEKYAHPAGVKEI